MKVKFSQFIFAILICFSFCNFALAQRKFVAIKFDEYNESKGADLKLLKEKAEQFAKALQKKSKSTQGLIYFHHRLQRFTSCNPWEKLEEFFVPAKKDY